MLISGDPEHDAHSRYTETFGSDEILSVAIAFEDAVSAEALQVQNSIVEEIEGVVGVLSVDSLATEYEVFAEGGELNVRPVDRYVTELQADPARYEQFRSRVALHPIWSGWIVSDDVETIALQVELDDSNEALIGRESTLREIDEILSSHLGVDGYHFAGHPFMKMEIAKSISRDLARLLPITIAAMALVLLVATRSVGLGGSAVFCVLLAVVWMIGAMGWLGIGLTALTNAAPTILLALATAYYLHLASAYQRRSMESELDALEGAVNEIFSPAWVAAITTAIGYGSLSLSSVPIVREFGWALALGVFFAGAIGTFVFPALICVGRPARHGGVFNDASWLTTVLFRIGLFTTKSPLVVFAASLAATVLLGVAALSVEVDSSAPNRFSEESRFRRSAEFYRSRLSGDVVETVYLAGDPGAFFEPDVLRRMALFSKASEGLEGVDKVISIADIVSRVNWVFGGESGDPGDLPATADAVAQLMLLYESSADADVLSDFVSIDRDGAKILLKADVRSSSESAALKADLNQLGRRFLPNEFEAYSVVSTEMLLSKAADVIVVEQLASALVAVVLILLLVGVAFRSFGVAALMLAPNLMPLAVCIGSMSLLGIPVSDATSIIAATAIGIAVDSTVHILAAAKRYRGESGGANLGVMAGVVLSGRPVVVSSAVIVVGFSILLISDFRSVSELGLLTALTMVCCLAADLVLLPAQMIVFSRRDTSEGLLIETESGTFVGSGVIRGDSVFVEKLALPGAARFLEQSARRVRSLPSGQDVKDVEVRLS